MAVDEVESVECDVVSGVPQGTIFGLLPFLIHIADIDEELQFSKTSTFADDTKVTKSVSEPDDNVKLQSDPRAIYDWASTNNMKLNCDKFQHLTYGKIPYTGNYETPDGNTITRVGEAVDLGILMEN